MQSQKILVTGGAGFIGSHLTQALVDGGHRVHVLDDLSAGTRDNLRSVALAGMHQVGVTELLHLRDELQGVETIFHLAALISGYDSLLAPEQYLAVNVGGTLKVIEFAREIGAKRVIFASSSTIYGQPQAPCRETDVPKPHTVYAATKLMGEHLLSMYAGMNGYSHVSLRLFNVYGPRQKPDHPYANVTCKFSHAAARSLPVDVYGDGEQSRDFVYVGDVVRAFLAVLHRSGASVYNVGTGSEVSINRMLETVEEVAGVRLARRDLPPWPNDTRSVRADVSRLKDEFGIVAGVTLREGLEATVNAFRTQMATP